MKERLTQAGQLVYFSLIIFQATLAENVWLLTFFFLLSFLHHDSTIMPEAIATIQMQTSNINHWVLHSLLIVIVEFKIFFSDSQALRC